MKHALALAALLLLASCDKTPEPGSAADKSAEGAMVRKAVADVDAAQAAAARQPASTRTR